MGTITESIDVGVDVTTAYDQWTQFEDFPSSWKVSTRSASSTTTTALGHVVGREKEWDADSHRAGPRRARGLAPDDGPKTRASSPSTGLMTSRPR